MFSNYCFAAVSTGQQLIYLCYRLFLDAQTHGITSELARGAEAQDLLDPKWLCSCFNRVSPFALFHYFLPTTNRNLSAWCSQ